jgi:hypothetical protein
MLHHPNITAKYASHHRKTWQISWRNWQTRCPCDRHVGVTIHHRGDRIQGVAGNAHTNAHTHCTICTATLQMLGFTTAISVYPCRGRPACLPFCGNVCPCATMFALQRNAAIVYVVANGRGGNAPTAVAVIANRANT